MWSREGCRNLVKLGGLCDCGNVNKMTSLSAEIHILTGVGSDTVGIVVVVTGVFKEMTVDVVCVASCMKIDVDA